MKQILKDIGQTLKELAMIPLGLCMWVGGVSLMVVLTKELGVRDEYAVPFMVVQGLFVIVTLQHFFGKKETKSESK